MSSKKKLMVYEIIDQINLFFDTAKKIPLTNKVVVEKSQLVELLAQLEQSIAPDLKEAQQLLNNKEEILDTAQNQANATIQDADNSARATIEDAQRKAQATVTDAQNSAAEMTRNATEQANAMLADAQARANALVADAQARAEQLVSENEITIRAQQEAQNLLDQTHQECETFSANITGQVNELLEHIDLNLGSQLDSIRALRSQINNQAE